MTIQIKINLVESTEMSEEIDGWFYRFWYISYGESPGTIVYRSRNPPSFQTLDQEVLGIDGQFHPFLDGDIDDQVFLDTYAAKKYVEYTLRTNLSNLETK